ncbi:MAG: ABC transporter permease subunit [Candidatus Dojkabacteria bacterium]
MKQAIKQQKHTIISALSIILFFVLWELPLHIFHVSETILVKPSDIVSTISNNLDILTKEMTYTIGEIIPGWAVGNLLGLILALLVYRKKKISNSLINTSILINSIPLIALTAILGGIIGNNQIQKVVIVSLVIFFPTFISSLHELTTIQQEHHDLLLSYSATQRQILNKVLLPKSLPTILNTIKVNTILAVFTAVTSEFFGGYAGIGVFILSKRGLYNLKLVWAAIIFVTIFGTIFYSFVNFIQKKTVRWQKT